MTSHKRLSWCTAESDVFADAGCPGRTKREGTGDIAATWRVAMRLGERRQVRQERSQPAADGLGATGGSVHPCQG